MARRSNPLTTILLNRLRQLDELKYQSFLHQFTTDKTLSAYRDALEGSDIVKQPKPSLTFGLSSRLCVEVLVGKSRSVYPVYGYGAGDEQHMAVVKEVDQRVQAQLLALAFESMESFFRDFMGKLYFLTRSSCEGGPILLAHRRSEFRKSREGKKRLEMGTPQYFEQYSEWYSRQNCDDLLRDLRKACARFDITGAKNSSKTNLFDFYRTLSVCRNLTVHASGAVSDTSLRRLPPEWANLLRTRVIRRSHISKKDTILPNEPFVRWAIERAASFMHMAYSIVSDELRLEIGPNL